MIDRAVLRKIWLVICWIIVVPSVFIIPIIGYLAFDTFYERLTVAILYRKVAVQGEYKLSDHHSGWDEVCVALPYCGEVTGLMSGDVCRPFLGHGRWGFIYFKDKKAIATYRYSSQIKYKGTDRCYNIIETPKILIQSYNTLTIDPE